MTESFDNIVVGGGSSVNAMLYIRGHANDYNQWAQLGNRSWPYDDVLPVFRDLESNAVLSDVFHGKTGELHVSKTRDQHPLCQAFVEAGQQVGLPLNPDLKGAERQVVGFCQTTTHDGKRWSAAQAFLRQAEKRGNLVIRTQTRVARVTFDGPRGTGVMLERRHPDCSKSRGDPVCRGD